MKKRVVGISLKTATFLVVFFATTFILGNSYSKDQKTDIKSEDKTFKEFSSLKFDISKINPLSFETKDSLKLSGSKKEDVFVSQVFTTPFKFNALGPHWKSETPEGAEIKIEVRLKTKDNWENWQEAAISDTDEGKVTEVNSDQNFAELIFANENKNQIEAFQYKVTLKTDNLKKTPVLKDISFNYIDSTKGPKVSTVPKNNNNISKLLSEAKAASSSLPVISRAGWGSPDPNGTAFQGQGLYWPPEYQNYERTVLHHTVTSNYDPDPASTVRAIWQYHTYSRGWGDIGYNFLIDRYGNIYEGRFGGENVVGGHAYKYNYGSIGIALLGTYSAEDITPETRNSLTEFAAERMANHNINPLGTAAPYGAWVPNMGGHREYAYYDGQYKNYTECPGTAFWSTIGNIRNITASKYPKYSYPWQIISQEAFTNQSLSTPVALTNLSPGQRVTLRLVIKNTSTRTWSNSGSNPVRLGTSNPRDRNSIFATPDWLGANRPTAMVENQVLPGQNASFVFDIQVPARNGEFREYFTPLIEGQSWMNDLSLNFYITTYFDYRWQMVSQEAFEDQSLTTPADLTATLTGQEKFLRLKAKNIGGSTWYNNGSFPIHLGTSNPQDRSSSFYDSSWLDIPRPAGLQEGSVAPGGVGTFVFKIKAPNTPGVYKEYVNPLAEGLVWMNNPLVNFYIVVNSPLYNSEFSSKDMPQTLYTGDTYTATIRFKNTGGVTWQKNGVNPVRLGTANPQDRSSAFATSNWLGPNRPVGLNEDSVLPGQTGSFTFVMQASQTPGTYNEGFRVLAEGLEWFGSGVSTSITVKGTYKAEALSSSQSLSVVRNQETPVTLSFKNTGTATWTNTSSNQVRLGCSNPQDRSSLFYDYDWLGPNRPAVLNESSVPPGGTGTFTFKLKPAVAPGTYNEYFAPLAEGETWMNTNAVLTITVNPDIYSWQFLGQTASKDLTTLSPGDTATLTLTAKNTGTVTWQRTGLNPTRVGTTNPRDRLSSFNDGTWLGSNRPVGLPNGVDTVAPGETTTFSWTIKAPGTPGVYREHFSLLTEGITWMNDPGVNYYTVVLGGTGIQVSGNVSYEVRDLSNNLLGSGSNWAPSKVYYINGNYYVTTPTGSGSTSSGVRFNPTAGNLRIDSYNDLNWNGTVNYNQFRGAIEVRYSPTSNALWAINELPLEDYLKGMAESSASSPLTHLETMAVVERSYGYYHISRGGKYPGEPFYLKNSRQGNGDDQVYAGYGFEILAPSIPQAVSNTSSQAVFYGGSPVITPFFSRSDGRTRSAQEVWGWTNTPWLVSVPDPDCNSLTLLGHGVGLSAYGALQRAQRGDSYQSILSYYYQGTNLGNISNPLMRVAIYKVQY